MERKPLTAGYVARLFGVKAPMVKSWSKIFAEYLSKPTNKQGEPRIYTQPDLRVFAVISLNYDPSDDDFDSAYSGVWGELNSSAQSDEHIVEFAALNSPVFQDIPDEFEYSEPGEHGAIIGGMADPAWIDIARAYRKAADMLVDAALENAGNPQIFSPYDVIWPILYNYRHCIELYLKIITAPARNKHSIQSLLDSFREKYKPLQINDCLENLLREWICVDETSTTFRYPEQLTDREYWVDLHHLKLVMGILCDSLDGQIVKGLY